MLKTTRVYKMSSSGGVPSSKTLTAGSQTSVSGRGGGPLRRRRTKVTNEKKIADDEFMAAAIGDVEWLRQSLRENGGQINYDKNGLTALHLAAIHGRLDCLKLCVEKFKQDVNLASSTGWRPVHLTISNQTGKRSLQCLTYLLEKSADPSIANDDGITPVHQAASEGHVQCLKLLIEVGAKIDGRDCRGNTPLDLAKLWGHRKCARILAAEMWHQDKNSVAKEMQQLKKVKMQQVLRELEDEEEYKAAQQFYGQQAYDQWLHNRGLEPKITGPPSLNPPAQEPVKEKKPMKKQREPLMKPNSITQQGLQDVTAEKGALTMSVSVAKKSSTSSSSGRKDTVATVVSGVDMDDCLHGEGDGEKPKGDEKARLASKTPGFVNPDMWNPSPKIPGKEYVTILRDEYPRDEYTMMPVGGQKFYDGCHAKSDDEDDEKKTKLVKKKLRQPHLPKEVVTRVMSADPSLHERPIVFKTKHIDDIHKKHKYTDEVKPVSEVPLHLCNDINSQMVKMSIRFPKDPSKPYHIHRSRSTSSKSPSSAAKSTPSLLREWSPDVYPLPSLLNTLKQMSQPDHFPNICGQEYGMNFGDLKI